MEIEMKIDMDYVVKEWDNKIFSTIIYSGVRYEDAQDLKSSIYLSMVARDFCGKYDPKKAQFSTYLYTFLHSLIFNYRRDMTAKKRIYDKSCVSLSDLSVYYDKTLSSNEDKFGNIDENIQIDFIIDQIVHDFNRFRCPKVFKNNTSYYVKRILTLCIQGYTIPEIARLLKVKRHEIQKTLKAVRQLGWLKDLTK